MSTTTTPQIPSMFEVARIASINDRVIRNLEITECYARLSAGMRARTGHAPNWCTFAIWASKQAGSTIRGEDFFEKFQQRLGSRVDVFKPLQSLNRFLLNRGLLNPATTVGKVVSEIHSPYDAFERSSEAVAEGNLKVFEEIGLVFARYLHDVPSEAGQDSEPFRLFLEGFGHGPPPGGQDYLREAFGHYHQQIFEKDPAARARWVLLANLKIGLHEQTRLQPQISAALEAAFTTAEELGARVLQIVRPGSKNWAGWVRRPALSMSKWLAEKIRQTAMKITREVITESMMVLTLPKTTLSLGDHLDVPVPPIFQSGAHTLLDQFISEHDRCPEKNGRCAVDDWGDLRQRMHYILLLFRSFGQDQSLFSTPFTPSQIAQFRSGTIPAGSL